MFLRELDLLGFRNLANTRVSFNTPVTLIVGRNGQGKTSLLEAVYLLALPRSFRTGHVRDVVQWPEVAAQFHTPDLPQFNGCRVRGFVSTAAGEKEICYEIVEGRRSVLINGKRAERAGAFFGQLTAVIFTPEELHLVKGAPLLRRQFIDRTISLIDHRYIDCLVAYQRALKSRNAILRSSKNATSPLHLELSAWDEILADNGLYILSQRLNFCSELARTIDGFYNALSRSAPYAERVTLEVRSNLLDKDGQLPSRSELIARLEASRERDKATISTSIGIHRDDLEIVFDCGFGQRDAKGSTSQGQAKSISLALKLSAIEFIRKLTQESPMLLLDDVESELDEHRKVSLYEMLQGFRSQVLISATSVSTAFASVLGTVTELEVANGRISPR